MAPIVKCRQRSRWVLLFSLARSHKPNQKENAARNPKGTGVKWPISLSRAVDDGGHRRPSLSASSTHKTPVRDHTPLLGQAPRKDPTPPKPLQCHPGETLRRSKAFSSHKSSFRSAHPPRCSRIIYERNWKGSLAHASGSLARIMHALSAAEPRSSALTALPTLGLLNRVHDYASAALGRNALSARRFRLFASTTRELFGLGMHRS